MILLDTDVLIEIERGNQYVVEQLGKCRRTRPDTIGITSAVCAEIIFGYLHQKKSLPSYFELFEMVDFDKDAAAIFAQQRLVLERAGRPIPIFDLVTASCIIAQKGILLTFDEHFRGISALKVVFLRQRSE